MFLLSINVQSFSILSLIITKRRSDCVGFFGVYIANKLSRKKHELCVNQTTKDFVFNK